jgi:hypothetical protein
VRPEIIAFLRFKPALLHDANATSDVNAWPTPRSWEMASNVLSGFARRQKIGFFVGATEIEAQLLEGMVGLAATTELAEMVSHGVIARRLLNVRDAAQYLGLEVDIYKKSRLREVPCVKVGRALRFDVKTLERYIEQHSIETIDQHRELLGEVLTRVSRLRYTSFFKPWGRTVGLTSISPDQ